MKHQSEVTFFTIPLEFIQDNPFQSDRNYDQVTDLADAIARAQPTHPDTAGLIQVPVGRVTDGMGFPISQTTLDEHGGLAGYLQDEKDSQVQLAMGHRRFRAFQELSQKAQAQKKKDHWKEFPIFIQTLDNEAMLNTVWTENNDRQDVTAVEKAQLIQMKLDSGMTQAQVGKDWGLARSTVANLVALLALPDHVREANLNGRITERQAQGLVKVVKVMGVLEAAGQPPDFEDHGRVSPSSWGPVMTPEVFMDRVLKNPDQWSSPEIRDYGKTLEEAGRGIPDSVATLKYKGDSPAVRSAKCKGCPARLAGNCFDLACYQVKTEALAGFYAVQFAQEHGGLKVDMAQEDPIWKKTEDYELMKDMKDWWDRGGRSEDLLVSFSWGGWGCYALGSSTYLNHDTILEHPELGVIIITPDGRVPDLVLEEGQTAVDDGDLFTSQEKKALEKSAARILKRVKKETKEAIADAIQYQIGSFDLLQAVFRPPIAGEAQPWLDDGDMVKLMATKLMTESRVFQSYDSALENVARAREFWARAGFSGKPLSTAVNSEERAQLFWDLGTLILDKWARVYDWHQHMMNGSAQLVLTYFEEMEQLATTVSTHQALWEKVLIVVDEARTALAEGDKNDEPTE